MNEKYGFDPSKQKMETEEYKYDKLQLDKLAAEKKALEEQYELLAPQENE